MNTSNLPVLFAFTGKLGLLIAIGAIGLAIIPIVQYEEKSASEKFMDDVKSSITKFDRHVNDDSKFRFSMEGPHKWTSLAMICAVVALALGVVSLATEVLSSSLAILIGIAVGLWLYFGR